jgi:hypothetical protein
MKLEALSLKLRIYSRLKIKGMIQTTGTQQQQCGKNKSPRRGASSSVSAPRIEKPEQNRKFTE